MNKIIQALYNGSNNASLRQITADIKSAQARKASGLKIASGLDNASLRATSQSLRRDIGAETRVTSGLAVAKSRADAAIEVLSKIQPLLDAIRTETLGLADGSGTPKPNNDLIKARIDGYRSQIFALVKSASFQGVNLLSDQARTISTEINQDLGTSATMNFSSTRMVAPAWTDGELDTILYINAITQTMNGSFVAGMQNLASIAVTSASQYMKSLTSYRDGIETQQKMFSFMNDLRKTTLGKLVDTDVDEEAVKLQALQARQKLAYQALSIGNASAPNILLLFSKQNS